MSFFIFLFIHFLSFEKKIITNYETIINLNNQLIKKILNFEKSINDKFIKFSFNNYSFNATKKEEFDSEMEKKYIENQHHFCQSNSLFFDKEIESKIKKVKAYFNDISFEMFVYNSTDFVSNSIRDYGSWESNSMNKVINCLKYYSKKKKLSKKEITILDIGSNVGWYSFYLANAGYDIYSFEVSQINTYILKKNFCLNENIRVTIINKGILDKEEKCLLHHPSHNIGNGVILCGENSNFVRKDEYLTEEIEFTKLSNYYNFLSKKNIALIKLDVEGSEGKVISSGIEFIRKYHVPFFFVEFRNDYLKLQGTNPKEFLKIFEENGYLFSTVDFFCKSYLSVNQILKLKYTDLYIIDSKFLDKD